MPPSANGICVGVEPSIPRLASPVVFDILISFAEVDAPVFSKNCPTNVLANVLLTVLSPAKV